jgi:hypothetical protein
MWLWLNEFVTVQSHFVIANAAGRWYFTAHDPATGEKEMLGSGCCCALYDGYIASISHFGSLWVGAICVSLMRPFKLVLGIILYAEMLIDDTLKFLCCCCKCLGCACCVRCFQKFFAYFGKLAFIELAINPKVQGWCCGYWVAAKAGADTMYSTGSAFHIEELELYHGGTWLFTFLGMMLVGAGCSTLTIVMASHISPWNDTYSPDYINDPAALAIIAFVIGAIIAISFMLVFDTAWDSLLLCMCYDLKDKRDNPAPGYETVIEEPPKSLWGTLTCNRFSKRTEKQVPYHAPVYATAQMEEMITGKSTPMKQNKLGAFASSSARVMSTSP